MATIQKIVPCLWFTDQAEEAARYYIDIFPNSTITSITRYPDAGQETHGQAAGSVLTVDFELDGQRFVALNGGPAFSFTEAISLQVLCETQQEEDHFWERLSEGGDEQAQQCGWLKDRYGLSWQVVPEALGALISDPDPARSARIMEAFLPMKKIDMAALRRAANG